MLLSGLLTFLDDAPTRMLTYTLKASHNSFQSECTHSSHKGKTSLVKVHQPTLPLTAYFTEQQMRVLTEQWSSRITSSSVQQEKLVIRKMHHMPHCHTDSLHDGTCSPLVRQLTRTALCSHLPSTGQTADSHCTLLTPAQHWSNG